MQITSLIDQFKSENQAFIGLLVIVWDDHVYEPVSSLLNSASGLFTHNSFAKDANNQPLQFNNLDGVILIRHLHQFLNSSRDEPLVDERTHPFDYGNEDQFPPKVFIPSPIGIAIPPKVLNCFQAKQISPFMGAEYIPTDFVHWV